MSSNLKTCPVPREEAEPGTCLLTFADLPRIGKANFKKKTQENTWCRHILMTSKSYTALRKGNTEGGCTCATLRMSMQDRDKEERANGPIKRCL